MVQNRVFRDRSHPFGKYNDLELYRKFRFTREVLVDITGEVANLLQLANHRGAQETGVTRPGVQSRVSRTPGDSLCASSLLLFGDLVNSFT